MLRWPRHLVARIQERLDTKGEEGFTLIELLIVMLIFSILLTIAIPSYLSLQDRANKTAAKQDAAQALKAVYAYANDNYPGSRNDPDATTSTTDNGYSNITLLALQQNYDASISTVAGAPLIINPVGWNNNNPSATSFCLTALVGRWTAAVGVNGVMTVGTSFTATTCTAS